MQLLQTFAALSLASGAVMALLPEGGLRKTAGMVVGLLMLLCWAEGIAGVLGWSVEVDLPQTVLSSAQVDVEAVAQQALARLQAGREAAP